MYAVVNTKNVFGISVANDFDACEQWLSERNADWQVFFPRDFVGELLSILRDTIATVLDHANNEKPTQKFSGPWLIFIPDDQVADDFRKKFC